MTLQQTPYAQDVRRFGSSRPFVNDNGGRMNLAAGKPFEPGAVTTDGAGNIVDMPTCPRKWCFGRPERFIRGSHDRARPPNELGNRTVQWQLSKCQRCAVFNECADVVIERLESDAAIERAFSTWAHEADHLSPKDHFEGRGRRLWLAFLCSIERHGGWTSVNDDRVVALEIAKKEEKRLADRRSKAEQRQVRSARHLPAPQRITPAFLAWTQKERDGRLQVLLDLRQQRAAPRWITRLSPDGCARTANVWMARALLLRAAKKATGGAIAQWLTQNKYVQVANDGSLVTLVCKDLNRIKKLEEQHASGAIWRT